MHFTLSNKIGYKAVGIPMSRAKHTTRCLWTDFDTQFTVEVHVCGGDWSKTFRSKLGGNRK